MYAVLIDSNDPNKQLVWQNVPDPKIHPGSDDVLIEIHAAALNRADLMQRAGNYPPPPGWPEWMGLEVAGVVIEAPVSGRWKIGDRVCALLGGGGYAEKCVVPAGMVLPIPDGLSMVQAAAIPEAFATSYLNLCVEAGMKSGDTVFIQAGASGLGMAAIQLAKTFGATVVTTVGSAEKARFVRTLGADVVINHRTDDLLTALASHTIDIAMDCVGGTLLGPCLEQMAVGGRWIVIATLGGSHTQIDLTHFFKRGLRLIGSTLRSRSPQMKSMILAELEKRLWPAFSSGELQPIIYQTLPITQAEAAHAILQRRENLGKVVLTMG
jgi:NADPH2:quinone reductase